MASGTRFEANAAAICAVNCALLIGVRTYVTFDPGYCFSYRALMPSSHFR